MRQTLCIIMLFVLSPSTLTIAAPLIDGVALCQIEHDVGKDFESKAHLSPVSLFYYPEKLCYATCHLVADNVLNFDGTLIKPYVTHVPKLVHNYRRRDIEVFNACANQAGADSCEAAFNTIKCILAKDVNGLDSPTE